VMLRSRPRPPSAARSLGTVERFTHGSEQKCSRPRPPGAVLPLGTIKRFTPEFESRRPKGGSKLIGPAVLEHIVQNDEHNSVRRAAEQRLKILRNQ